ncbi:MAG: FAD-dependent monooxygenase [Pseudomonadota bacterium]
MMDIIDCDVLVVGGGPAGLTATALFAQEGFATVCIDRAEPVLDLDRSDADLRTTALLIPSIETLKRAQAWPQAGEKASDLAVMRMMDAGDGDGEPASVDFNADEIEQPVFGANIANTDLRAALLNRLGGLEHADLRAPAELTHLVFRDDAALATLSDGTRLRAKLVIGADGRNSVVRERLGIGVKRVDYPQRAMVFIVAHDRPHQNVSTEILRTGGPFTLVPYLDRQRPEGGVEHRSSVVWMESFVETDRLTAMDDAAFEAAVNERSQGVLGHLRLASRRASWPMVSMIADRWHAPRAALIAEAAHVVPPIGAQGLNMSLKDAETLLDLALEARTAGRDIGDEGLLSRYTRARWSDAAARVSATAALNQAAIGPFKPIRDLRRYGLQAIAGLKPLKQTAMRYGMGGAS